MGLYRRDKTRIAVQEKNFTFHDNIETANEIK